MPHLQVQALRSRLAQTEAKIQTTVREAAPSQDSKKEAQELQQLRAQLEESLRNEERLRKQLEEVRPPALHDRSVRACAGAVCAGAVNSVITACACHCGHDWYVTGISMSLQESSKQAPSLTFAPANPPSPAAVAPAEPPASQTSNHDTAAMTAPAPMLAPDIPEKKLIVPTEAEAASPFAVLVHACTACLLPLPKAHLVVGTQVLCHRWPA